MVPARRVCSRKGHTYLCCHGLEDINKEREKVSELFLRFEEFCHRCRTMTAFYNLAAGLAIGMELPKALFEDFKGMRFD